MRFQYRLIVLILWITAATLPAQESGVPDGFDLDDFSFGEETEFTGYEETFSIYGYMINYFQASTNYADQSFSKANYGDAMLLRLKGDWRPENNLRFHVEFGYMMNTGNQNPYILYEKLGLNAFSQSDFPLEDFNQRMFFDHVWGMVNMGSFDLQFGKFPIAWGTAYFFNPTARVSFPPFLDMVTEDTPGALAVLPSYAVSPFLSVEGYIGFQDRTQKMGAFQEDGDPKNLPLGIKVNAILGSFDFSASYIREILYLSMDTRSLDEILETAAREYVQGIIANQTMADMLAEGDTTGVMDLFKGSARAEMMADPQPNNNYKRSHFLGFDFAGAVWNFGIYGELAFRLPRKADDSAFDLKNYHVEDQLEAAFGMDYLIPGIDLEARLEYFYQGTGVRHKSDYNLMSVLSGERLVNSRNYIITTFERTFAEFHKILVAGVCNLNDGSFAFLPGYSYLPYNNFEITVGAFVLGGSRGSEFDGHYTLFEEKEVDLIDNLMPYLRLKISF